MFTFVVSNIGNEHFSIGFKKVVVFDVSGNKNVGFELKCLLNEKSSTATTEGDSFYFLTRERAVAEVAAGIEGFESPRIPAPHFSFLFCKAMRSKAGSS